MTTNMDLTCDLCDEPTIEHYFCVRYESDDDAVFAMICPSCLEAIRERMRWEEPNENEDPNDVRT